MIVETSLDDKIKPIFYKKQFVNKICWQIRNKSEPE